MSKRERKWREGGRERKMERGKEGKKEKERIPVCTRTVMCSVLISITGNNW